MVRIIKIRNLIGNGGMCDYKGLDITKFVPGSHHYEIENGLCIVKTVEDTLPEHLDLEELTEEQQQIEIDAYNSSKQPEETPEQKIARLESDNTLLQQKADEATQIASATSTDLQALMDYLAGQGVL